MSTRATITFHKLVQNTQEITPGTSNQNQKHMASKAFFTLDIGGKRSDMSVVLRQPFGTDYTTEPIEAERPIGPDGPHKGNWNHNQFRDAAEDYYRSAISTSGGGMISIGPNAGVQLQDNLFNFEKSYPLDIPD